jgi:hypothetical protein
VLALAPGPLVACGDDAPAVDATARQADAWVQVLRTVGLADAPPPAEDEPLPVLFAMELDGGLVPPGVQVEVVNALKDEADVRFLDERDGAIAEDEPGEPVKDDGVLVAVGPVPDAGSQAEIDVERYRAAADRTEFVVVLTGGAPTWVVASVDPPV